MVSINESGFDRIFRIVLGLVLLSLAFIGPQTPWGFIGVVPLLTGLIGWCPIYRAFGVHTNHAPPKAGSGVA